MKETDKNLLQEIAHLSRLIKKNEERNHPKENPRKKSKNFTRVNCDIFQSFGTSNQYFSKPKPATEPTLSSSKHINRNAFPSTSTNKSTSLLMKQSVIGVQQLSKLNSPSFMYINPKLLVPDSCRLLNLSSKGKVENDHYPCSIGQSDDPLDVQVYKNVPSLPADSFKIESNQQQICHRDRGNRYKYLRAGRGKNDCTTSSNVVVATKQEIKTGSVQNNFLKSSINRFTSMANNHTQTTSNARVLSTREKVAKRSDSNELSSKFSFRKTNNKNYSRVSRNSYKLDRRVKSTPCASTFLTSSPAHNITSRKKYPSKIITRFSIKKTKTTKITPSKNVYVFKAVHSESKIVKIQGTTYESKNKGKTLKRVRTSNSFSQTNAKLDFHSVHRPVNKLASRVLKKSKSTLIKSRTKKNIFCKFYNLFGMCKRLKDGTCKFSHDQRQVFVCSKYVVGKCQNENCTLSHDLKGKIPSCRFFRKGLCSKKDCPFIHLSPRKLRKKKTSCSVEPSIVKRAVRINDGESRNIKKQNPVQNSLDVSKQNVEIDSRYYKLDAKGSPVKSVIPRRVPTDLIERIHESDESDASNESDNSEDFDSSCDSDNDSDETEYKSDNESDLIKRNDETKSGLVNSEGNGSNVVVNPIVVRSNNENLENPGETLNCTTHVDQSSVMIAPTDHAIDSSVTVKNSTTEKRQRLIGLQERFKQRVAIIRNCNESLPGNIPTAPHFDHTLH